MLLYGFGSKRALLDKFARETLTDGGVLAVNCLALGLTARQVLLRAAGMFTRAGERHFRCAARAVQRVWPEWECGMDCLHAALAMCTWGGDTLQQPSPCFRTPLTSTPGRGLGVASPNGPVLSRVLRP